MSTLYPDLNTNFPNSVQTFVTMLDMVAVDGDNVAAYQAAMEAGDTALANYYYNQITNASQKIINANKINVLQDTCVALQRFYQTDIQPYITSQQAIWNARINNFSYLGDYDSQTQYKKDNYVTYLQGGSYFVYICTQQPPTVNVPPTNATYWRIVTAKGSQGTSGQGLAFMGIWSASTSYTVNDVVTYNNAVWGCTQNNINQPPQQGSAYWGFLYTGAQTIYPFQETQPEDIETGELWIKRLT